MRFRIEEENFELVSVRESKNHRIDQERTIALFSIYALLLSIRENWFLYFCRLTANAVNFNCRDPAVVSFERNSVCCIRFPFPYSVFYFALPSLYPYLLILFQFVLRPFTKNTKRRSIVLQPLIYSYRAQVTFFFTLGAFTIERPYRATIGTRTS